MPEMFAAAQKMTDQMRGAGWNTPDTYSNHFEPFPDLPGIYLFIGVRMIGYSEIQPLYAGKSLNLRRRHLSHEAWDYFGDLKHEIDIQRWFTVLAPAEIDRAERELIQAINPRFNIALRRRGH